MQTFIQANDPRLPPKTRANATTGALAHSLSATLSAERNDAQRFVPAHHHAIVTLHDLLPARP